MVAFSTGYDELRINNVGYSGTKGPQGVVPRGSIFWSADAQQQSRCGPGPVVEVCAEAIVSVKGTSGHQSHDHLG